MRISEVLNMVDLTERAGDLVETYSGGMRKRLDIACGLIHRPRLLFLDEPTLGLDIQTRREIWRYVNQLRSEINMTIFLTTHYMDEADALCDRIAIIDHGQLKAVETPSALKSSLGGDTVEIRFDAGSAADIAAAVETIRAQSFVSEVKECGEDSYQAIVTTGEAAVPGFSMPWPAGACASAPFRSSGPRSMTSSCTTRAVNSARQATRTMPCARASLCAGLGGNACDDSFVMCIGSTGAR